MRLIIAGSRTIQVTIEEMAQLLSHYDLNPTTIISGTANGVDRSGEAFAKYYGIPLETFVPNWDEFGKSAGYRRNKQMAEKADALLLVWDGKSRGSMHMRTIMLDLGKPVFEAVLI